MIIRAPEFVPLSPYRKKVFLSGAIDMGKAVKWQNAAENALDANDVLILNPRRDDWDSSWTQDRSDPQFFEQVSWELNCLDMADVVLVHFPASSKAPITFMELGLYYSKAIVSVEPEFYRKGNIDIVCEKFGIPEFEDLNDALEFIVRELDHSKRL